MTQMPQDPRERLNILVATSKEYEAQANQVQMQIDFLNQNITAIRIAGETIEGLGKMQEGQEILLPLANLAFIKTKVMDTSKVILNVGAGVNIEKSIGAAKDSLDNRLENLSKSQMQLRQALQQLIQQIEQIRAEIEKLAAQMQQGRQQQPMMGS